MNLTDYLRELQRRGLILRSEGESLRIEGPKGVLIIDSPALLLHEPVAEQRFMQERSVSL